jgi:2-isopropylmalate synthase
MQVELHLHDRIQLKYLNVQSGKNVMPTATVQILVDGELLTGTSTGNGPIDAAFTAVKKILKRQVRLDEFLVQAITRGSDDVGKVHVQIEYKGMFFHGLSVDTDIITASVEAFLDCISKAYMHLDEVDVDTIKESVKQF